MDPVPAAFLDANLDDPLAFVPGPSYSAGKQLGDVAVTDAGLDTGTFGDAPVSASDDGLALGDTPVTATYPPF